MKIIIDVPEDLLEIVEIFNKSGRQLFLVGGCVRDALMNLKPKDYDVATDANPDEIISLLRQYEKFKILEVGKSFGVIKVVTSNKNEYEIATFRSDVGSGRRPDSVVFTTIQEDVKRRDFTINALFYDFEKQEVIDLVGGLEDINKKTIRTVGKPQERFNEDRLRILRAVRFSARFGKLEHETYLAIKQYNSLSGVSGERIKDEFLKGINSSKSVSYFFDLIDGLELWSEIFPGLSISRECEPSKSIPITLALLLKNNEPKKLRGQLNILKYSSLEISQIMFLHSFQTLTEDNAFSLKKLYAFSHLEDADLISFANIAGTPSTDLVEAFISYQPTVDGQDLLKLGFTGKQLGQEMLRLETENFKCLIR